jgi:S-formylglutathione hydrolase FrmB
LLYLHGVHLQRLVDKPKYVEQFVRYGLPVVAPVTQRSWWTDRICPEFDPQVTAERHVLDRVLPWIEERFGATPPRIGLFGTSMGGQGALRIAYKHPRTFPVVAAVSPALDFQNWMKKGDPVLRSMYRDVEAARQETVIQYVRPLDFPRYQFFCCCPQDEEWFEGAHRLRRKLASLGVPFQADLETPGAGHGFAYYETMAEKAIGFLVKSLEENSRRLV